MSEQIFERMVGVYPIEHDRDGPYVWTGSLVEFAEAVGDGDSHALLMDIPQDILPATARMTGSFGARDVTLGQGLFVVPRGVTRIELDKTVQFPGDSRELGFKLRAQHRTLAIGDEQVELRYELRAERCNGLVGEHVWTVIAGVKSGSVLDLSIATAGPRQTTLRYGKVTRAVTSSVAGADLSLDASTWVGRFDIAIRGAVLVRKASIRVDWFDFHCLESSEDKTRGARQLALTESREASAGIPRFVQWYVTWKCNYSCAYCWQEANPDFYRSAPITREPAEKWAQAFNALNPEFLYLTGGEPTLYKYLPEMLSMIDPSTRLMMTTNVGYDLDVEKFVSFVSPSQFAELMVSYHPTQVDRATFLARIERLHRAGFTSMGVEMVLSPPNLGEIDFLNGLVAHYRLQVRYDDYHPVQGIFVPDPVQARLIASAKAFGFRHNETLGDDAFHDAILGQTIDPWYLREIDGRGIKTALERRDHVYCAAGMRKITVDGHGDVYACTSAIDRSRLFGHELLPHYSVLGNVLDGSFCWNERPLLCGEAFRCSSCDFQVLDKGWVAVSGLRRMILPE